MGKLIDFSIISKTLYHMGIFYLMRILSLCSTFIKTELNSRGRYAKMN